MSSLKLVTYNPKWYAAMKLMWHFHSIFILVSLLMFVCIFARTDEVPCDYKKYRNTRDE